MEKREKFTDKIGFILSCTGAAIGLGNIWLFSWKLGKYGGAAFLIPYFIFMSLFAFIGLVGEISFGRMMKKGVLEVPKYFKNKIINYFPLVPIVAVTGIYIFYVIVFGWVIKYFYLYLVGDINHIDYEQYFFSFAGTSQSIPWHLIGIILSIGIISIGVVKGIEKLNKIVMPLMFIIFIGLLINTLKLDGAMNGVNYLIQPKWEELLKIETWVMALGQAFFTVGISGAALLVYGSYLKDDVNIVDSVIKTCILDTIAALMAGFIIIPAAFAFNLNITSGPALLFITIPTIFKNIPFGNFLGAIFFLSIIFAALSSTVNLLEVPVETLIEKFNMSRKKSAIIVALISLVLGLALDINIELFGKFADFMSGILLPIGAVLILGCYFYGIPENKIIDEISKSGNKKLSYIILKVGKYIFIPGTIIIILLGIFYGNIG